MARSYRYRVLNSAWPDPLVRDLVWHVREPLEIGAMQLAADQILGAHDFTSFSKKNKSKVNETFIRTVDRAHWRRIGGRCTLSQMEFPALRRSFLLQTPF